MKYNLLTFCLVFLLIGCGKEESTINGINDELFEESIEAIQRELPSDQQPKLREAISLIYNYGTHQDTKELKQSRTRQMLNMKSANEVFTIAESIAKRKNIDWSRSSLGPLDLGKIKNEETTSDENSKDETLKNAKSLKVHLKKVDQNRDGTIDGMMVFPELLDDNQNTISYQNAENNVQINVFSNNEKVFNRNAQLSNSAMGNPAMQRGIVLPYSAFDAERIKGDNFDVSVTVNTPFQYFTADESGIPSGFQKFMAESRVNKEEIEAEKSQAKALVEKFLTEVGQGNLTQAHSLSVNPDWRDYNTFSSDELGFGAVKNANINSVNVSSFDPQKEKAVVVAQYVFTMKGDQELPLKKQFVVQKISGEWKIVGSQKVK